MAAWFSLSSRRSYVLFSCVVALLFTGCLQSDIPANLDPEAYPLVVLGGGTGGLTAALYAAQGNMPVLVIQGPKPGGALAQSSNVCNWPGALPIEGMQFSGAMFTSAFLMHAIKSGATVTSEQVVAVDLQAWPRTITTASVANPTEQRTIKALNVIVATGTEPNYLGVPGEQTYWGKGVTNCAVCDGSLCKGKDVLVVGGGDAAIAEAEYLSSLAKTVYIAIRKDAFRTKDLQARDRVLAKNNVQVLYQHQVQEILGDGGVATTAVLVDGQGNRRELPVGGVFLAIGSRPNTALFKNQLDLDERGFIKLVDHQETAIPGVYAVGDVCDSEFVQAITAAGDGCKAALQALKRLKKLGYVAPKIESPAKGQLAEEQLESAHVVEITNKEQLDELVLNAAGPVVVDVFATWCSPCKQMLPVVHKLAASFAGKVSFVKYNIDNAQKDGDLFSVLLQGIGGKKVTAVPTFLLIRDGKEVERVEGGMSEASFQGLIKTKFGIA